MSDKNGSQEHGEISFDDAPIKWLLNINDLPDQGVSGKITADADELRALTKLLNDEHDLEVRSFRCTYKIKPEKFAAPASASVKTVEGCRGHFQLRADLRQTCVVTLERMDTLVEEEFSQNFASGRRWSKKDANEDDFEDPFAEEPPLPIVKGRIELGPLAYQYFSMAIDPNPRKTDVRFESEEGKEKGAEDKPPSPFVVLKDYKHQK